MTVFKSNLSKRYAKMYLKVIADTWEDSHYLPKNHELRKVLEVAIKYGLTEQGEVQLLQDIQGILNKKSVVYKRINEILTLEEGELL